MTNLSAPGVPTDQAEVILQVFQNAPHPITTSQAEKNWKDQSRPKLKKNELRQIVESQLLMQGRLFRCSPSGKNARYWVHDEEHMIREKVEELLNVEPLAEGKLATAVNNALPKISSPAAIKNYIQTMRREGLLHDRPGKAGTKTMLLSLQPASPFDAISLKRGTLTDLSNALAKVESLGGNVDRLLQIIREQLRRPAPAKASPAKPREGEMEHREQPVGYRTSGPVTGAEPRAAMSRPEIDELILKGMRDLDSAVEYGASVLLRDLRRHMPGEYHGHDTFDVAVLRLADQDRIVLHRDDQPACLTDAERDELVRDEEGTYYVSIAKRV
jgi:hypothetical protein